MPRKSLVDEAYEAAVEELGVGADSFGRLAYESAYETVIGRLRQGRRRRLGREWERDFLEAAVRVAQKRLETMEREDKERSGGEAA